MNELCVLGWIDIGEEWITDDVKVVFNGGEVLCDGSEGATPVEKGRRVPPPNEFGEFEHV